MNGEVPTSYVRGNSVHESFARVVTIHAVHFLTVEFNVGYRVHGHNYFVEDGIETKNVIRYNLAISSLTVTNMLQTDISVASFWVTNPSNDFYGNHAAGGDFYGIWYEIKANPDGPSATNDVCPIGNPLGNVQNNTAHSNIRFGFRIFKLYSREYPCQDIRNDSDADNPWAYNPSITSNFTNFTVYKNLEDGVLSEQTGNVVFDKFVIA
jgi:6-pyruvoyl-tetrahydropterin synthase